MQQRVTGKRRVKVDVDSSLNLEHVPFPLGGTAALVPPYPAYKNNDAFSIFIDTLDLFSNTLPNIAFLDFTRL